MLALLLVLSVCFGASAQLVITDQPAGRSEPSFKPGQLVAPALLITTGSILHFNAKESFDIPVDRLTSTWRGDRPKFTGSDYLRFLPVAADLSLGCLGVDSKHSFIDRSLEAAWAYGLFLTSGYVVKHVIDSPRPDGSSSTSFPSGHAGMAFAGAELVRIEYGWGWGAGAYAVAAGISVSRLYDNEHWASDLLAGAGLGLLCAHAGEWLLEPTKDLLGLIFGVQVSAAPSFDPRSGALTTTFCFNY